MSWTPLLSSDEPLTVAARAAVEAIVQAVDGAIADAEAALVASPAAIRASASPMSRVDVSLLYAYLALSDDARRWGTSATTQLNVAIDGAPNPTPYLGLHGGLAGLGWTVEHLSRRLRGVVESPGASPPDPDAPEDDEDLNADLDALLLARLRVSPWRGPYDLIGGLVGIGVYFLERAPSPVATMGVGLVLDRLAEGSTLDAAGRTWHTAAELLPAWQREICPNGYRNLGVAHGIPGILYFLSEAITAGLHAERAAALLDDSMAWLIAQRRPAGSLSLFGSWSAPSQSPADSRLAWCYGDLGIMAVLRQVADAHGREDWRACADDLLTQCLHWPAATSGVVDVPLCHGAAGIAHVFNRLYQAVGDQRCGDAARAWFAQALAMRELGEGAGGFRSVTRPDPDGPIIRTANLTFLDGAIGIALALLAAVTPMEPEWDRLLLLSGRG